MRLGTIGIVYRKEMLDSLRDRRTLISMVAVPVLVMPLLILGMGFATAKMMGKARQSVPKVMVLGGGHAPRLMKRFQEYEKIELVAPAADYTNQVVNREIRVAVLIPEGFDDALGKGEEEVQIDVYHYEGDIKSGFAARTVTDIANEYRTALVDERLEERNLKPTFIKPFGTRKLNVAPATKVTGKLLGGILPYCVILLCMVGAMYPAMDLTAGEKERGTMETLLCSPLPRTHLVLGKFLTVLTAALATALLALISMSGTFQIAKKLVESSAGGAAMDLPLSLDFTSVAVVFLMVLPMATFFSAAQLAIALFAKSFKEAQTYLSPLMFVVVVPAMISMTPGIELNLGLSLVPVLNTSLVSKEIMTGNYNWGYIVLIFLSSVVYAGGALMAAVKLFNRESVVFRV